MTTDTITRLIQAAEQAREALQIGQDAFSQAFGGYGYYRPDNPHNFFPDPECCTPEEIANHSAACEAYDKGTYVPDHKDGWITPEVHVTAAPWGIGTYTDECKEITDAIATLTTALEAAKQEREDEPVAWVPKFSWERSIDALACKTKRSFDDIPLYTTPPAPKAEPVAWVPKFSWERSIDAIACKTKRSFDDIPLYAAPPVPEGWVLVPVEPTYEMEIAGPPIQGAGRFTRRELYKAMLAAAPKKEG